MATLSKGANSIALPEDVRDYELMVILPPDLTEAELKTKVADLKEALSQHGGKVLDHEVTPLREFAYRIGKYDRGYYVTFHFTFSTEFVNELERLVRIEMGVVRHLLVTCPKNYAFKGLMAYEEEAEALRLKESEERKAKENEEMDRRSNPRPKMAPRAEKPAEVPASVANIPSRSEGTAPAPRSAPATAAKPSKPELNKVDEQLKAILDNPDIQI